MSVQEWPAEDYAIGSYIQSSVAEKYLSSFSPNSNDQILDLGCGNGSFSKKILEKVPNGSVLGMDASENMLRLAKDVSKSYPNFSVTKGDMHTFNFNAQFDYVVSFWCLQWTQDIHRVFENIYHALKRGGKLLAVFPAGDDPYINGYYAFKKSGQFSFLNNFIPPMDYSRLDNLSQKLRDLPFTNLKVELCKQFITLPSLDVFRKFVNGIAFYQGQVSDEEVHLINQALVKQYDEECQKKYQGKYRFDFTIYVVTGVK